MKLKTTKVEDIVSARTRVEVCLRELNQWMLLNNLRLNTDKTELLVLHANHRPKPPLDSITVMLPWSPHLAHGTLVSSLTIP